MKNKKIIIGAAGILAVLLLILPGVLGNQIERQTVFYFKEIYKATSNQNLEIKFEKRWFTSTATVSFELPQNYFQMIVANPDIYEKFPKKQEFEIQIIHGPIIYPSLDFGLAGFSGEDSFFPVPSEELKEPYNSLPGYSYHGVMSFGSSATSVLKLPAFEMPLQESLEAANPELEQQAVTLKFQEILIESEAIFGEKTLNLKLLPFQFFMSATKGQDQEFEMGFEDIQFDGFYLLDAPYPINYDRGTFSIGKVNFKMEDKELLIESVNSADFVSRNQASPILQYNSEFQIGPISFHEEKDEDHSPQVLSTKGSVEMANIQGNAIVKLMDVLVDISEPPTEEQTENLKAIGEEIFSAGLEYNFPGVQVETQWGKVDYIQRMIFPPIDLSETFNPQVFFSQIFYLGNFELDEGFVIFLVDQALKQQMGPNLETLDEATLETLRAATLAQLLVAKYLVKNEDGTYVAVLLLENGIFTLNGNPMDLLPALGQIS